MEPSVSVVIPTFNRRRLVERALASVAAQTRAADEVIVVDDGSTDGTGDLVQARFSEVKYLFQENRGVSAARNRGIREAAGEWIALLDSDDEWLPEKLERQLSVGLVKPGRLLIHCDELWYRNGRRVNPGLRHKKAGGHIFQKCLPLCAISPSAAVIHRSVFGEIGFFDESFDACEDYDFWLRFCSRFPVLYIDEPLVIKHGGRGDQLSASVWGLDRFRIRALEKILDGGVLSGADLEAAENTLIEKIDVYAAGAGKRGRRREVERLQSLRGRHLS